MQNYNVTGMSCAACSARVEKVVSGLPGVTSCSVSLLTNSMSVEGTASEKDIIAAVEGAGYGASLRGEKKKTGNSSVSEYEDMLKDTETPKLKRRLIISLCLLIPLMYVSMGGVMWGWPLPAFLQDNPIGIGVYQMLLSGLVMTVNQKFFINGFSSPPQGSKHGYPGGHGIGRFLHLQYLCPLCHDLSELHRQC